MLDPEATSAGQAEAYQKKGFTHTKALTGGVKAWQEAGYGVGEAATSSRLITPLRLETETR